MELQSLCCNFDLEDKLNLSQLRPQKNTPLALCVIDPRPTATYQPPKSTSTQAQICRFMQEALHAQFHLLMLSGQSLDDANLGKCLKLAQQQLEFFLQKHQWQAYVHTVILIPNPNHPGIIKVVHVGNPTFFSPYLPELETDQSFQSKLLKRGFGTCYPFTVESKELHITKSERYVVGFLSWQPLKAGRSQDLIHARWESLPEIITDMMGNQELPDQPFFLIQISVDQSHWIENIKQIWRSGLHAARRLTGTD